MDINRGWTLCPSTHRSRPLASAPLRLSTAPLNAASTSHMPHTRMTQPPTTSPHAHPSLRKPSWTWIPEVSQAGKAGKSGVDQEGVSQADEVCPTRVREAGGDGDEDDDDDDDDRQHGGRTEVRGEASPYYNDGDDEHGYRPGNGKKTRLRARAVFCESLNT